MASPKPFLADEHIPKLVEQLYGLRVTTWSRLDGYDDLNIHVKVDGTSKNVNVEVPSCDSYVLKVSNGRYTLDPENITAQNSLMLFVSGKLSGVETPLPVRSVAGDYMNFVTLPWRDQFLHVTSADRSLEDLSIKSHQFIVRLLTFMPGVMLSAIPTEPGVSVLEEIGGLVGSFVKVMKEFHPDGPSRSPVDIWALENVVQLISYLEAVDDPIQLTVFREVIDEFTAHLTSHRNTLDHGVIHGDMNEGNIVMTRLLADDANLRYTVKGIIDFSDTHYSCRIFDLVLAVAYMMLECQKKSTLDPIIAGAHVVVGYLHETSLTPAERDILKIGVEARITQSLILGQHTFKHHQPGNLYVLNTQKTGWSVLQMLRRMTQTELFQQWRKAVPSLEDSFLLKC